MNRIRLGTSALFVIVGAVFAWAVTYEAEGIDLNRVGLIVFFAGLALAVYHLATTVVVYWTTTRAKRAKVIPGPGATTDRRRGLGMDREIPA